MDADEKASIPLIQDQREQLWARLGNDYEARILATLSPDILMPSPGRKIVSERLATAFLMGQRKERYVSQINLRPASVPTILEGSGLSVRQTAPDLVEVDRTTPKPVFSVIDIKATRSATAFHKAQVAFYVRMLETVLKDIGIDAALSPTGQIWRIPDNGTAEGADYQIEEFDLKPYLRMIDKFCETQVGLIASTPVGPGSQDKTFFHLYFKCEQCDYLPHCVRTIAPELAPEVRDVSAVAGLSHEAKRALHRANIRSVAQLAKAEGIGRAEGIGWTLQRKADQLRLRAKSLVDIKLLRSAEEHSFLMPSRVNVAIALIADYDPVDDMLVTVGYQIWRQVNDQGAVDVEPPVVEILAKADRSAEADALCGIFAGLLNELGEIDAHNRSVDETGLAPLRSHIFFYEPSEAVNLQRAIGRHLEDDRIRSGLLNIVRIFPPDDVVPEPEFRGAHHLPATAVRSVVEQLYALPVMVSFDLRQVSSALAVLEAMPAPYEPEPQFERPFSSLLAIDVIRGLREDRQDSPDAEAVKRDVVSRFAALKGIVEWLFEQDEKAIASGAPRLLRLAKRPFVFHASFDPLNAEDLDVLRAMEVLESRAGLLDALINLAQPSNRRRDSGRCVAGMRMTGKTSFGVGGLKRYRLTFDVPPLSRGGDLKAGDFGLILTDDDPDLRLDATRWADCGVKLLPRLPGRSDRFLTLDISAAAFDSTTFQMMLQRSGESGNWHLDQGYTDINAPRAAAFINALIAGPTV